MPRDRVKALVWIFRPGDGGAPEVLLLERPQKRGGGEHPVTGNADRDEAPPACATREAAEETGLFGVLVDLHFAHEYRGEKRRFEEHAFLLRVAAEAEPELSSEHVGYRWTTPADVRAAVQWPAHQAALEKALLAWR